MTTRNMPTKWAWFAPGLIASQGPLVLVLGVADADHAEFLHCLTQLYPGAWPSD